MIWRSSAVGREGENANDNFMYPTGNCSWVSIDNARVRSQNDHQLVITCNHGYILVGPRVLSCEVDGSLNGTLSSCIRGSYFDPIVLSIYIYILYFPALMRSRGPKQYCLQLDIALWHKKASALMSKLSTLPGMSHCR